MDTAPVMPVPAKLAADCERVERPDELTFGGTFELPADAMKYIADSNHDKRAIRDIEAERAKKSPY